MRMPSQKNKQSTVMHACRVGAETLQQEYGVTVDPHEFAAFAGMGEAHFLRGVAGKHGIVIEDIGALKEIYYGIYLAKVADSNTSIGLPGGPCCWGRGCLLTTD